VVECRREPLGLVLDLLVPLDHLDEAALGAVGVVLLLQAREDLRVGRSEFVCVAFVARTRQQNVRIRPVRRNPEVVPRKKLVGSHRPVHVRRADAGKAQPIHPDKYDRFRLNSLNSNSCDFSRPNKKHFLLNFSE
jgi:hypothetical protein